ncbi:hypothetical protein BDV98DRAFT_563547, partial [Pterulicium gracile]
MLCRNLSFALCHVYARSTRSVSVPAPVYYADIVCSRVKNHYDPAMHSVIQALPRQVLTHFPKQPPIFTWSLRTRIPKAPPALLPR